MCVCLLQLHFIPCVNHSLSVRLPQVAHSSSRSFDISPPCHTIAYASERKCLYVGMQYTVQFHLHPLHCIWHCYVYFPENEKHIIPTGWYWFHCAAYTLVNALQLNLRIACEWLVFNWFCGLAMKHWNISCFFSQPFSAQMTLFKPFSYPNHVKLSILASRDMHNKCKRNPSHSLHWCAIK